LLDPKVVQIIVDGRQPENFELATLMRPFSPRWLDQLGWVRKGAEVRS